MRRVSLILFTLLAFAAAAEAQRPLACTVHVEIKDATGTGGANSALIDSVLTPDGTHCELGGKARFIVNNSSDIDVTVVLKEVRLKGASCANPPTGGNLQLPLDGFNGNQLVFKVKAQDLDTKAHKISTTASANCYKFNVWLYLWNAAPNWISIDDLDPDLDLSPPSGPPPAQKKGPGDL